MSAGARSIPVGRAALLVFLVVGSTVHGGFTPPANCTWTLSKGSTYTLQQRHGNSFGFDSLGRLASITDKYNQSLSVSSC